ncbi:putative wall-associated receptor kinase-like 16 isoform X2 [Quercus robur]|uniref:putative wall-associated receptor kinase-like 16 isoform X2 n=1 Tax=Quercus robur TaxID=38942 RepID=UPI002163D947|nr:putative wall-associated receptor kinase-like 16 isoform X2 [Quercus robur]
MCYGSNAQGTLAIGNWHKVLLTLILLWATEAADVNELPAKDCDEHCGNISIPYPFGTREGCYKSETFLITCNRTNNPPIAFLGRGNVRVTDIWLWGELRAYAFVAHDCHNLFGQSHFEPFLQSRRFPVSSTRNKFTAIGCDTIAVIKGTSGRGAIYTTGCISLCDRKEDVIEGSCSGIGCCQTAIPKRVMDFNILVTSYYNRTESNSRAFGFNPCSLAFVVEEDINECEENPCSKTSTCTNLNGTYRCSCLKGYEDNSGSINGTGCKPIPPPPPTSQSFPLMNRIALGVSVSLLLLLFGISWLYLGLKQRKHIKRKQKFFEQNGGFLLQQQLSRHKGSVETTRIFTAEELKKATNNYHENRILGQGGQGTVYKGILSENRIVAIKKSRTIDRTQIEQFINEVIVLSQVNHRNVVKLLGCCLETQVPMLVYEFVTNGTLFNHIHNTDHSSTLQWHLRLQIATETAETLSYLHFAASTPIIHRDIKSTNVLLDDNFTAKVSDFGASRLVPLDQTQLTTLVQGTLGYLDPEYFQSSQLTEKSDVYSFGVLLAELLTGKKALSFDRPEEERNLAMHFILAMKDNRLFEILDQRVVKEGNAEQLMEVAMLVKRCLRLKGEERPTMKEVALELEGLKAMEKPPRFKGNMGSEETEFPLSRQDDACLSGATSDSACYDSIKSQVHISVLDDGR